MNNLARELGLVWPVPGTEFQFPKLKYLIVMAFLEDQKKYPRKLVYTAFGKLKKQKQE